MVTRYMVGVGNLLGLVMPGPSCGSSDPDQLDPVSLNCATASDNLIPKP